MQTETNGFFSSAKQSFNYKNYRFMEDVRARFCDR